MLKITYKNIDKSKTIMNVERHFKLYIRKLEMTDVNKQILKDIDKAIFMTADIVKTPFGLTTIDNLSSGCKAAALIAANTNEIVNFNEAGDNAFEAVMKAARTRDISIATSLCVSVPYDDMVEVNGKAMTMHKFSSLSCR